MIAQENEHTAFKQSQHKVTISKVVIPRGIQTNQNQT